MDFSVEMAKAFNVSPFQVFKEDKDEVIMMINYFIEKGETINEQPSKAKTRTNNNSQRIRVNDQTASGGWF